jgi:hypothetical protein
VFFYSAQPEVFMRFCLPVNKREEAGLFFEKKYAYYRVRARNAGRQGGKA